MEEGHYLITGGSSGIGFELAKTLVNRGAHVHLTGRRRRFLEQRAAELGPRALAYPGDVSSVADRLELIEKVTQNAPNGLDGLVINAAMYGYQPLLSQSLEEFEQYFQTNTVSSFHLVQLAHPLLKRGSGKAVLFISSTLGNRPVPGTGAYAATKAALNSLAQSYALELAPDQIRVNALLPGVVDTAIHEPKTPGDPSRQEKIKQLAPLHPLGRVGLPGDIAAAAAFLLSAESSWVTGSLFFVDGGISLV